MEYLVHPYKGLGADRRFSDNRWGHVCIQWCFEKMSGRVQMYK